MAKPLVSQFLEYMPRQVNVYFTMPWNRLAHSALRILIPVVATSVAQENAAVLFQPLDEMGPLHAI
jgi:hypothetical protein